MPPGRTCEGFQDIEAVGAFRGDISDVGPEGEEGIISKSQDFGVFV